MYELSALPPVLLDTVLTPHQVWQVAQGARLQVSAAARARVEQAHALVAEVVARELRVYGVSTGVGMLADTRVSPQQQSALSRNLVLSHAAGVGEPLAPQEVRAIMACAIANYCHGYSGLRWEVVQRLLALLNADCIPVVPRQGSVGYVSHMAHLALVLLGLGQATLAGRVLAGADALAELGLQPLVLEAKEGLSLVGSAPCAAGLACVAWGQARHLVEAAHGVAALSFEALGGQPSVFDAQALALRQSAGVQRTGARLRDWLQGSPGLAQTAGRRTQDALTLRAIPQVHGAVIDVLAHTEDVLCRELASATDNPLLYQDAQGLQVMAVAHAVACGLGLAMETLGTAVAQLGVMSERRLDRLLNPLVSGLPPFLAQGSGVASGFMIAQYTALSLTGDNRRLAAPAALDAGVTSGLQEDMLCHATPSALKAGQIVRNTRHILAIELVAALQACDGLDGRLAPRTAQQHQRLRQQLPPYRDDRPLHQDLDRAVALLHSFEKIPAHVD